MVKNKVEISPSILAADCAAMGESVAAIKAAGLSWVHFDVMDAHFVPNLSFGPQFLKRLSALYPDMFFDVHLMMDNPHLYVDTFAKAGASLINVHLEPDFPHDATLQEIHLAGCKVGMTIKPKTSVYDLVPYLNKLDLVLIMTVEPGFGGQKYMDVCTDKIRQVRKAITERGLSVDVEIDGGVTAENIGIPLEAGANVIVAGSAVFRGNITENIKALMAQM